MAKRKPKVPMPVAKCHVKGCTDDAVYGFRETIDVTNNDSQAREFIMGDVPNWCLNHDAEMRTLYASKNGKFVGPL